MLSLPTGVCSSFSVFPRRCLLYNSRIYRCLPADCTLSPLQLAPAQQTVRIQRLQRIYTALFFVRFFSCFVSLPPVYLHQYIKSMLTVYLYIMKSQVAPSRAMIVLVYNLVSFQDCIAVNSMSTVLAYTYPYMLYFCLFFRFCTYRHAIYTKHDETRQNIQ